MTAQSGKNINISPTPAIHLKIEKGDVNQTEFTFKKSFQIGRDESCEVQLKNNGISRFHAEVFLKHGRWWLRDLNSSNGTYVNGKRIDELPIGESTKVELGRGDAILLFSAEEKSPQDVTMKERPPTVTQYVEHYFGERSEESIGDHTRMIRDAFNIVHKKHRLRYLIVIAATVVLFFIAGIYAFQKHRQVERQKVLAEGIFYSMKTLELELADMRKNAELTQNTEAADEIRQYRLRHQELATNYDKFLQELHIYDGSGLDDVDQIIFRIARIFGECELSMPKDFVGEVQKYIKKWQTTDRMERAIRRAVSNGYADKVSEIMLQYDLPPQFFYLALQESDFKMRTVGPKTRYGIAKGIWQFIPQTAMRYGLRTGPLVEINRFDPRDDRFHFERATRAAAKYLRDLYETEAQASGLLVMASYNWGEKKVTALIRKMPQNPRERNFWQLLRNYRQQIPQETYDYVFYIISAAVIGENPRLFGFSFDNPFTKPADQLKT